MAAWLFLILLLPLIAIYLVGKNKKPSKHRYPPGPPGLPFIGNLHQFDNLRPQQYLKKLSDEYGPLVTLKLGKLRVLVISSADMVRDALKNHDIAFSGRPSLVVTQRLSYGGLDVGFATYGEYWREMRKITVLHLLSMKKVHSFRPVHEDEIAQLMNRISTVANTSETINIRTTIVTLTSRIICRIAFGNPGDIVQKGRRSANDILADIEALLGGLFISDYIPSLGWIDKFTGNLRRLDKSIAELNSFYEDLIEEHMNPNRPEWAKNNILDLMIQLKEEQYESTVDLTWDHIKAMLTNIFIAATQSSAASIIWAMTCLMKNPSTLKRLQTEIRDFFGDKTKIEADKLQELPYLSAVIKEALRLHVPVPLLLPRETIANCKVGGYEIEPNTFVFINAWAIARDPKTWEDPDEFKPERFLNIDVDVIKGQNYELIPFGSGRRGCPGAYLALVTVELVIANLLNFFDWELPPGMKTQDIDTEGLPGLTMLPKNPLCVLAKKRAA